MHAGGVPRGQEVIQECEIGLVRIRRERDELAFIASDGAQEDPATGSLNAGLAQWLLSEGLAPERYVVSQGTAIGRAGRIRIGRQGDEVWVGGAVAVCIEGRLQL
ncbi:Phenazine biosynthesis protein PhzF like [Pseudomonas sp. R3-18-08]|nr:Phenazine biosynthesis protein PhzF like [Pseudomonas sp. R3-18-08]